MKKSLSLLAALCFVFTSFNAFAGGDDDDLLRRRRGKSGFGVHLNLPPMAFGTYSLNAEYGFAKNMSAALTVGFVDFGVTGSVAGPTGTFEEFGYSHTGFIAAPEFRYYLDPSRMRLDKWFVGGFIKARSTQTGSNVRGFSTVIDPTTGLFQTIEATYGINYFGLSAGATVGYMLPLKSGLTFGFWTGFGYFIVSNVSYTDGYTNATEFSDFSNLDIRLGITAGYRF